MKSPRQAAGQRAKALPLQDARLVDRLEIAALVDGARRRVRRGDGPSPMTGTPAAVGEAGALAMPTVAASRFTDAAAARTRRTARMRLLAAVHAWVSAGQLGPDRDTTVGRQTGVRC
jgi:hypothetical protein